LPGLFVADTIAQMNLLMEREEMSDKSTPQHTHFWLGPTQGWRAV
jgi:hypothetical protein